MDRIDPASYKQNMASVTSDDSQNPRQEHRTRRTESITRIIVWGRLVLPGEEHNQRTTWRFDERRGFTFSWAIKPNSDDDAGEEVEEVEVRKSCLRGGGFSFPSSLNETQLLILYTPADGGDATVIRRVARQLLECSSKEKPLLIKLVKFTKYELAQIKREIEEREYWESIPRYRKVELKQVADEAQVWGAQDTRRDEGALEGAEFVHAITAKLPRLRTKHVDVSDCFDCMMGVPLIENEPQYIALLPSMKRFWDSVIRTFDTEKECRRICCVGSPGVGKSLTATYLIRLLLLKHKKTVVYLKMDHKKGGFCFSFTPQRDSSSQSWVDVHPHHEASKDPSLLHIFDNQEVYVVCDAGGTKEDCNPSYLMKARMVLIASPDSRHWGGGNFTKRANEIYKFFPLPTIAELWAARCFFMRNTLTNRDRTYEVRDSYRGGFVDLSEVIVDEKSFEELNGRFGPIPGIFFCLYRRAYNERQQQQEIDDLTDEQVKRIMDAVAALDCYDDIITTKSHVITTKSHVISVSGSEADDFRKCKVAFVSRYVEAQVHCRYMRFLLKEISITKFSHMRGGAFENYVRLLFCSGSKALRVETAMYHRTFLPVPPPNLCAYSCTKYERVVDIISSVKDGEARVIYYPTYCPVDMTLPWIDFIYMLLYKQLFAKSILQGTWKAFWTIWRFRRRSN